VRIERDATGAAVAAATDGRRLVAVTWPEADADCYPPGVVSSTAPKPGFATILPIAACQAAGRLKISAKTAEKKPVLGNVVLDEQNTNGKVPMGTTDLASTNRIDPPSLEGRFPRWRDVVPSYDEHNSVSFAVDARFLAEVASVIGDFAADDADREIVLSFATKDMHLRPMMVSVARDDGRKAVGIIMPINNEENHKVIVPQPQWRGSEHVPVAVEPAPVVKPAPPVAIEPAPISPPAYFKQPTPPARPKRTRKPRQPRDWARAAGACVV
jgi:hypothetical protein